MRERGGGKFKSPAVSLFVVVVVFVCFFIFTFFPLNI